MKFRVPILAPLLPLAALAFSSLHSTLDTDRATVREIESLRIHTNFPALSPSTIVASSTSIVHATVIDIEPFLHRPGWVCRRVTFAVHDHWKGQPNSTETIIVHGGRIADTVTIDSSAPDFVEGESWVLYLQSVYGLDESILSAGAQAAGRVTIDRTGKQVVSIAGGEIALSDLQSRDTTIVQALDVDTAKGGTVR